MIDPARDDGALVLLRDSGLPYQCLFDGQKARDLAAEAPYLVSLAGGEAWVSVLVRDHWDRALMSFVDSPEPFFEVRRSLRRLFLVRDPRGEVLFFRFYDPRILRVFLPTCDRAQAKLMFGAVDAYLTEGDDADELWELAPESPERPLPVVATRWVPREGALGG